MSDSCGVKEFRDADALSRECEGKDIKVLVCNRRTYDSLAVDFCFKNPDIVWITPEYHEQHKCFVLTKEAAFCIAGANAIILLDPQDPLFTDEKILEAWASFMNAKVFGSLTFLG